MSLGEQIRMLVLKRDAARRTLARWSALPAGNQQDLDVIAERRTFWRGRIGALQADIDELEREATR